MSQIEYSSASEYLFSSNVQFDANVQITTGASANYILETDANGNVSWRLPPGFTREATGEVHLTTSSDILTIGTSSASGTEKVRVLNGSVLFDGTTGAVPTSGAGTRLFWAPAKAAFRAGVVSGTEFDNANVGTASAAFGTDNQASGNNSLGVGSGNTLSGNQSAAIGSSNVVSGANSLAVGSSANVSGTNSLGIGLNATSAYNNAIIQANGNITTAGDIKTITLMYYLSATGNSWETMTFDGGAATTNNTFVLPDDTSVVFTIHVTGKETTTSAKSANFILHGAMQRDTGAASTALIGTVSRITKETDSDWSARVNANTTLGGVQLQVLGRAAQSHKWSAQAVFVLVSV